MKVLPFLEYKKVLNFLENIFVPSRGGMVSSMQDERSSSENLLDITPGRSWGRGRTQGRTFTIQHLHYSTPVRSWGGGG